jgi:hypothetical protein
VIDPRKGRENLWEGERGGWMRRGQAWHAGVRLVCRVGVITLYQHHCARHRLGPWVCRGENSPMPHENTTDVLRAIKNCNLSSIPLFIISHSLYVILPSTPFATVRHCCGPHTSVGEGKIPFLRAGTPLPRAPRAAVASLPSRYRLLPRRAGSPRLLSGVSPTRPWRRV